MTTLAPAAPPVRPPAASEPRPAAPVAIVARGGAIDGAGRQLLYLLRELDRVAHPPLVVVDVPGPMEGAIASLGVPVAVSPMRPWRSLRGLPFRGRDARAIARLAAAHGARLVHCSDTWRTPYARAVARRLGVPLVAHVRGPATRRDLAKNGCLDADAVVVIAARYRDDAIAAGVPARRVRLVNDAVDCEEYARDPLGGASFRAARAGGGGVGPLVGIVGRVEPFKRVIEFVEMAAAMPRDVGARFAVVGSLSRAEYVERVRRRIAELGVGDRVELVGRRDDMPAVLSGLDVLATLSGGSVMFEAQACGTPVVSVRSDDRHSRHTAHGETAWCASTESPRAAADALATLLRDDELRRRIADNGRRYVLEHLSPTTLARQTEAVYASVLEARAAAV